MQTWTTICSCLTWISLKFWKIKIKIRLIQRVKRFPCDVIIFNSSFILFKVRAECMVQKIEKAQRELYFNLGRYPSDEETAKFTGFTLAKVRLARRCSRSIRSLEKPFKHGSSLSFKVPPFSLLIFRWEFNHPCMLHYEFCMVFLYVGQRMWREAKVCIKKK